jgi:hypothetical protein
MTAPLQPSPSSRLRSRKPRRLDWPALVAFVICAPFAAFGLLLIGNVGWDGGVARASLLLLACVGALSAGVYAVCAFVIALLNALIGRSSERDR